MASLAVYAPSKNIYAISEVVPDTDDRNLQQFYHSVKCLIMWHVMPIQLIGDATDAALIIDEVGLQSKKGLGTILTCFLSLQLA